MAKGARKGAKKGGKKGAKRSGGRRKVVSVRDEAFLSETRTLTVTGGFNTGTMYSLMNTALDQFTRATLVAKAYQHYRIKYIQLRIKPTYDTFATGGTTKHNVYYMIDKSGSIPTNITLEGLKNMGAKPRQLDEKTFVIGWRPSVMTVDMTAGGAAFAAQPSQYKISPWLTTNNKTVDPGAWNSSTVDHLGVYWYVEQIAGAASPYVIDVEVQFEFKKPLIATATGAFEAVAATFAQSNASRDGVVDSRPGGDDEELVH